MRLYHCMFIYYGNLDSFVVLCFAVFRKKRLTRLCRRSRKEASPNRHSSASTRAILLSWTIQSFHYHVAAALQKQLNIVLPVFLLSTSHIRRTWDFFTLSWNNFSAFQLPLSQPLSLTWCEHLSRFLLKPMKLNRLYVKYFVIDNTTFNWFC